METGEKVKGKKGLRKMQKKKMMSLAAGIMLGTALLLSGCSKKEKGVELETGDISENSVVMLVGDDPVRFHEIHAYCYFLKCQYEGSFGEELWEYPLGESETIGDRAKQEVVNMITQLKIISATAQAQGVELTADEKDEALRHAEELIEKASQKDVKEYSLNVQQISEIYQENALANKMFYIATDEADTNVSDEEARQVSIQCLQVMTEGINRNGMEVSMDEEAKQEALKRAERLREEAEKADDFLGFAEKNTDASQTEWMVGKDTEQLEDVVVEEALRLASGEMSQIVEGEQGYYILYCVSEQDEEATYAKKEEIIAKRQTEMFMGKYSEWMQQKKVDINQSFWNEFSI